jgi:hypothetical protein
MSGGVFAFLVILGLILIVHYLRKIADSGERENRELRHPDQVNNVEEENRAWIEKYKNTHGNDQ